MVPVGGRGPRRRRLSRSAEFERVYRQGRSKGNRFLVLYAFPREDPDPEAGPRLGLSVSRRVGGAGDRTRVKRVLREASGRPRLPLPLIPVLLANVFQPLIDVFESVLKLFHDSVGLSWGASIIALTLVVRSLLLPLTLKQFKSMQRLAHLQPEMKKLQDRYKNDKERLNQEMMRFYRENKVNPFASCLPMVAQIPVFISLFYMLRVDLRHDICPQINPAHVADPKPCGPSPDPHCLFIRGMRRLPTVPGG